MLENVLEQLTQPSSSPTALDRLVGVGIVVAISLLGYLVARLLIFRYFARIAESKAPAWHHAFQQRKVYRLMAYLVPVIIAGILAPWLVPTSSGVRTVFAVTSWIASIILTTWIINNTLSALLDIYDGYEMSKSMPLNSLVQAVKVILYILAAFLVVATLLDLPVVYFIAGFFALVTAAGFVLKDPILGFMAGIQLAGNKMVEIGDRIEMPQYGVDGFLQEISLITVKIRNIDHTISTVPTYALVSESFKNWHDIIESTGRRIQEPLYVDVRSLKVVDDPMLMRLQSIPILAETLTLVRKTTKGYSLRLPPGASYDETSGNLTNLGLFRTYAIDYLHEHPGIYADQRISVHVLEGTDQGIPIEIWAYTRETIVPGFHRVRSEIFEHLFSMIPLFGLELYQSPTGSDLLTAISREDTPPSRQNV